MKKHFRVLFLFLLFLPCLVFAACDNVHIHSYEAQWQNDSAQHWQICECGQESAKANHTWNDGVVLEGNEATFKEEGTKTFICTACDFTRTETVANSLSTFAKLNDAGMYFMEYAEDYKFDTFLQTGAANDEALAKFLSDVLLEGLPVEIQAPKVGCSTFSGELTGSGDRIFARNFDFSYSPSLVIKTNPSNGYQSISTVNLGFIGYTQSKLPDLSDKESLLNTLIAPYIPLDGLNEKGLAIGVLQLNWLSTKQDAEGKINLPTTTMIRMVLDKAATVDEAIALMQQYNMRDSLGANFHYQIADKTGKSVVVEYVNNQMKIVETSENYHLATNYYLHPDAMDLVSSGLPSSVRPTYSCSRYNTMKTTLMANNGIFASEQEAMSLLQAVKQNSTQWSVVYNLETLTSIFVPARQYDQPAYTFSL